MVTNLNTVVIYCSSLPLENVGSTVNLHAILITLAPLRILLEWSILLGFQF
jgi:hypothetical protein